MMLPIIAEFETVEALRAGKSIARFGDGELRLALGRDVGHQKADKKLVDELKSILLDDIDNLLVGIPWVHPDSPKKGNWLKYTQAPYIDLYNPQKQYYSSFITRPDSAPWIDTPGYWHAIQSLWHGRDVIIVSGSNKGFRINELESDVASLKFIKTLPEQAYNEIDKIEEEIGTDTSKLVLLAVGATATVLAARLVKKGFQALDLGHLPMFIRRRTA